MSLYIYWAGGLIRNDIFWGWQGDITRLSGDAIENAANNQLLGCFIPLHGCIDNAIHSAAGIQLRTACNDHIKNQVHLEPTGSARLTKGFNLSFNTPACPTLVTREAP